MAESDGTRPRKKQRIGVVALPPSATTSNARAKFAFGSRLPVAGKSLLRANQKKRRHETTRMRTEQEVRAEKYLRKPDEEKARPRRNLTVKTNLPLEGSHLPPPTKVAALLRTIPQDPAARNMRQRLADQQGGELTATDPDFWIKSREAVEVALKELDMIEKRMKMITK